jgi:pimeloyl-ACP methyl ester carboxylesterase
MDKTIKGVGAVAGSVVSAMTTAAAGWLVYSKLFVNHNVTLPPALGADREHFGGGYAGMLHYYADRSGEGTPLLLVHAINAAASAYEMRPLFEHYRGQRPVYALELPGFGFSQRGDRPYTPRVFTNAIIGFLETQVEEPVDIVALSLSSEFAARAALERAQNVRSLALISPTGLGKDAHERQPDEGLHRFLSFPLWSQACFDLLTTRAIIRRYLSKSFYGEPDERMVDYSYKTSHQPGARYAPFAFVSGKLSSPDIRESVYEQLEQPVLVLYDQDPYTGFEALPGLLERHPNWQAKRIPPTRGLPHWEQPEQTFQALNEFWNESPSAS